MEEEEGEEEEEEEEEEKEDTAGRSTVERQRRMVCLSISVTRCVPGSGGCTAVHVTCACGSLCACTATTYTSHQICCFVTTCPPRPSPSSAPLRSLL